MITHKSWPHVSCVFQASLATKGNWIWARMQTYEFPLQPAECVCLKNIEETVFFFWVQTEFPHPDEHFCFWQMEGGVEKKRACNYEKRGLKEKVETQRQNWTEEEKEVLSVQEKKTAEGSVPLLRKSPFIGHQKGQEGNGGRNWRRGTVCNTYANY